MNCNILPVIILGLMLLITKGASGADPQENQDQHRDQGSESSVRLGLLPLYTPEYQGSDDYGFLGYPLVYVTGYDTFFVDPRTGAGAYLWNRSRVRLGVFTAYSPGRDEDSSSDLAGLGDIDDGATGGVVFESGTGDYFFHTRYEQRITGEDTGSQAHLRIGLNLGIGEKVLLQGVVKTTYSSSGYMNKYFGISPSQSSQSGLPAYVADSGFKSFGFEINAFYGLRGNWAAQALAEYNQLIGDTADSPVVKDKNQYLLGVGLLYSL